MANRNPLLLSTNTLGIPSKRYASETMFGIGNRSKYSLRRAGPHEGTDVGPHNDERV